MLISFFTKITMSDSINCNFAWCAVQHFVRVHLTKNHILPRGAMPTIVREYNAHFSNETNMQVIKRFLEENNVSATSIYQRPCRAKRRCIKKVGAEGVSFPMYPTVKHGKQNLLERIEKGEVAVGKEVVPSYYQSFTVDSDTHNIQENTVHITTRKVSLLDIRKKLLKRHESLEIVHDTREGYFDNLSPEDMANLLQKLGTCIIIMFYG